MARLTEQMKRFIIMEYAVFRGPTEIARRLEEVFGVVVDKQQVHNFNPDPTIWHRDPVAKKWVKLYEETRAAFREETEGISVANVTFRLREAADIYRRAKQSGNLVLAMDILAQAAKEMGGCFTNRQKLTGSGRKDLPAPASNVVVYLPAKKPIDGEGPG